MVSRLPKLEAFKKLVEKMGFRFVSQSKKTDSDMFVMFEFIKSTKVAVPVPLDDATEALQPCLYKRR